jgi:hypothetical protein
MTSEPLWTLIGVVIGAFIPVLKDFMFDRGKRIRLSTYAAIRIVCVLDDYVDDCIGIVTDEGELNQEHERTISAKRPVLASFATDIDWQSIDPNLAYRTLSFSSCIDAAKKAIAWSSEMSSPPDHDEFYEEQRFQYAQLGKIAFDIASEFRSNYSLPSKYYDDWNSLDILDNVISSGRERRGIANLQHRPWYQSQL